MSNLLSTDVYPDLDIEFKLDIKYWTETRQNNIDTMDMMSVLGQCESNRTNMTFLR